MSRVRVITATPIDWAVVSRLAKSLGLFAVITMASVEVTRTVNRGVKRATR
jgi:hypothetical protein